MGCYLVGYLVWLRIPGEQRFADLGPLGCQGFRMRASERGIYDWELEAEQKKGQVWFQTSEQHTFRVLFPEAFQQEKTK